MKSLFPDYKIDTKTGSTASTDFGNVTYACPAFHPGFGKPLRDEERESLC